MIAIGEKVDGSGAQYGVALNDEFEYVETGLFQRRQRQGGRSGSLRETRGVEQGAHQCQQPSVTWECRVEEIQVGSQAMRPIRQQISKKPPANAGGSACPKNGLH